VAETHIFDFNDDIYGQPIRINLLRHLRGEVKFNSVAELSAQIRKDIARAQEVLAHAFKDQVLSCEEKFDR
ncbi:MAG: riboflavin biosynthesis protein RibF, partial [Candidatus Electrothrix sp. AR3]|nr:riboflavin biosynthesis protein RibF [Candidatus Electrothrix sp. AR3]